MQVTYTEVLCWMHPVYVDTNRGPLLSLLNCVDSDGRKFTDIWSKLLCQPLNRFGSSCQMVNGEILDCYLVKQRKSRSLYSLFCGRHRPSGPCNASPQISVQSLCSGQASGKGVFYALLLCWHLTSQGCKPSMSDSKWKRGIAHFQFLPLEELQNCITARQKCIDWLLTDALFTDPSSTCETLSGQPTRVDRTMWHVRDLRVNKSPFCWLTFEMAACLTPYSASLLIIYKSQRCGCEALMRWHPLLWPPSHQQQQQALAEVLKACHGLSCQGGSSHWFNVAVKWIQFFFLPGVS